MFKKLAVNEKKIFQIILLGIVALLGIVSMAGLSFAITGLVITILTFVASLFSFLLFKDFTKTSNISKVKYYSFYKLFLLISFYGSCVLLGFAFLSLINYYLSIYVPMPTQVAIGLNQVALSFFIISSLVTFICAGISLTFFLIGTLTTKNLRPVQQTHEEEAILIEETKEIKEDKK